MTASHPRVRPEAPQQCAPPMPADNFASAAQDTHSPPWLRRAHTPGTPAECDVKSKPESPIHAALSPHAVLSQDSQTKTAARSPLPRRRFCAQPPPVRQAPPPLAHAVLSLLG